MSPKEQIGTVNEDWNRKRRWVLSGAMAFAVAVGFVLGVVWTADLEWHNRLVASGAGFALLVQRYRTLVVDVGDLNDPDEGTQS